MSSVVKTLAADTHAAHGHDHSHGHGHAHSHDHVHSHGHAATGHAHAGRHPAAAPSPSLLRFSVWQRLAIVLPIGALLWAVALWVIASGGAS